MLPSEKLFVTKTVHEVVFGYQDEMLEIAKRLKPSQFYTDMVGVLAGVSTFWYFVGAASSG